MKNYARFHSKEILKLVLLLSSLQLSAEGKPLPGCSQTSEIELYDPADPAAETTCVRCPECPEGQGLSTQCGSGVPKGTKIQCVPCQANVSYSNSHGIESCKACQECGLRNVIQHCTTEKNRICGTKCPQGYYLDHNHICQECYFCCGSVSEARRRQGCKDIGMGRDWQCERTKQNQRCKEVLQNVTTLPTRAKSTANTAPPDHNTIPKAHSKFQVHDSATTVVHLPTKSLSGGGSLPTTGHGTRKEEMVPANDGERENGQEKHGGVFLGADITWVVSSIAIILAFALIIALKTRIKEYFGCLRTNSETADSTDHELTPLNEPNTGNIPTDCHVSEMGHLHNSQGEPMLFHVQHKLDVVGSRSRKTWRSVGRAMKVNSEDLDLIETDYKAGKSPTESLLEKLKTFTPEPTMKDFVKALIICKRNDVANYICNWPWEEPFNSAESENL